MLRSQVWLRSSYAVAIVFLLFRLSFCIGPEIRIGQQALQPGLVFQRGHRIAFLKTFRDVLNGVSAVAKLFVGLTHSFKDIRIVRRKSQCRLRAAQSLVAQVLPGIQQGEAALYVRVTWVGPGGRFEELQFSILGGR